MSNIRQSCNVMAKPTGSICNLDCKYCFYLEKDNLYPDRNRDWKMSDKTLEQYIKQQIEAQLTNEVVFSWQGGEPTMMGVNFYKKAVEFQDKYRANKSIVNSFQTNAVLIDDEWCEFFKENDFLIGVSIDGPAPLHDHYRVTRSNKPSFNLVMKGIGYLKKHSIRFNTLTVVNDVNVQYPLEVYDFLKSIGTDYFQFIPLVERRSKRVTDDGLYLISPDYNLSASVTPWSVKSEDFGKFLNKIFDVWVRNDVGKFFVQMFDTTLGLWLNLPAQLCVFSETCGNAFALEADGDIYACDHYVYPEYKLGNLHETSIFKINNGNKAIGFGNAKRDRISSNCKKCQYRFACNGGCPKHRFVKSNTGKNDLDYFCKGHKMFFRHSEEAMKIMRDLISKNRPPTEVMGIVKQKDQITKRKSTGRNDPCYCGSGKKHKQCCLT